MTPLEPGMPADLYAEQKASVALAVRLLRCAHHCICVQHCHAADGCPSPPSSPCSTPNCSMSASPQRRSPRAHTASAPPPQILHAPLPSWVRGWAAVGWCSCPVVHSGAVACLLGTSCWRQPSRCPCRRRTGRLLPVAV